MRKQALGLFSCPAPSGFLSHHLLPTWRYRVHARFLRSLALISATLVVASAHESGVAAADLVTNKTIEKVDFEKHVMGLVGRMGCNTGGCHGSFQGKGGFRLSLFGYDPAKDFASVTRDGFARRVSLVDPDNSLLLLKATGQVTHGGGMRFSKDSWQY